MKSKIEAGAQTVTEQSRKDVAWNFNQIRLDSERYAAFAKLSFGELARLAHKHEIAAAEARYALWQRHEENNAKN